MTTGAILDDPQPTFTTARAAFDSQHAASRREPAPDLATRLDRLDRIKKLVLDNKAEFIRTISADFGNRSAMETEMLEIVPLVGAVRYAKKRLPRWIKPERRHVDMTFQPAAASVRYEPVGVVGIISPWNYPIMLALSPLVDALAAGNRAMLKPSELTPGFSALLQKLIAAHFDPSVVTVVTGGPAEAQAFSALPFDHLVFTGSTAVGRKVMQAAAANLTPVTLELGGKSPAIVCADYPLAKAARSIVGGKLFNGGQTCIAPDYALVPLASAKAFADAVMARIRKAYPKIAANPDYTSIISQRHYDRLKGALEEARAAGATILTHEDDGTDAARKIGPTLVLGAPESSLLLTEEIFGPILPIVTYERLEDAIAYVQAKDRPLALYGFTNDKEARRQLLDGATSGGVTLNGTILHIAQDSLPFGGIGPSGMGHYHGFDGFKRFSHARAVHKIGRVNAFERLGPPWGRMASGMASFLLKR